MTPTYADLIDAAATALLLGCGFGGEAAAAKAARMLLGALQARCGVVDARCYACGGADRYWGQ
jgi:hypothetical protein